MRGTGQALRKQMARAVCALASNALRLFNMSPRKLNDGPNVSVVVRREGTLVKCGGDVRSLNMEDRAMYNSPEPIPATYATIYCSSEAGAGYAELPAIVMVLAEQVLMILGD